MTTSQVIALQQLRVAENSLRRAEAAVAPWGDIIRLEAEIVTLQAQVPAGFESIKLGVSF